MSRRVNESKLITELNPLSPITEAYRTLKMNVQFSKLGSPIQTIAVTSSQPGEGKTTTISNLAVAYAQEEKKVLLVDTDLRNPSIHKIFKVPNKTGLTNLITQSHNIHDIIVPSYVSNLSLLTSGSIPYNPTELLLCSRMKEIMNEVKNCYDLILFDTPPILAVSDGIIIASQCDGVILVVQARKVTVDQVQKSKSQLEHAQADVLGIVLNKQKRRKAEPYYSS